MNTRDYPYSGYIKDARLLACFLPQNKILDYLKYLDDNDFGQAISLLEENTECVPLDIFVFSGEDIPGKDMKHGVSYAVFDDSGSFKKTYTDFYFKVRQ